MSDCVGIRYCERCDCNYDSFFGECYCCNNNDDIKCSNPGCHEEYNLKFCPECPYCHDSKWTDIEKALYKGDIRPLYKSIASGGIDLYNNKATIDYRVNWGWTALIALIASGNIENIKKLLDDGANPNCLGNSGLISPIYIACQEKNVEVFKMLIDYGADPNLKCKEFSHHDVFNWERYWEGTNKEKEQLKEYINEFNTRFIKG